MEKDERLSFSVRAFEDNPLLPSQFLLTIPRCRFPALEHVNIALRIREIDLVVPEQAVDLEADLRFVLVDVPALVGPEDQLHVQTMVAEIR